MTSKAFSWLYERFSSLVRARTYSRLKKAIAKNLETFVDKDATNPTFKNIISDKQFEAIQRLKKK